MEFEMKYILCLILFIACSLNGLSFQKYVLKCDNALLVNAVRIAKEKIGTKECDCRNSGDVSKYLNLFNAPNGSPYCCAGIYYCFYYACKYLEINNNNIPIPKTMLANRVYDYAQKYGDKANYLAKPGDLILWRKSNTIYGHIEMIHQVSNKGWVITVGFNTYKYINNVKVCGVYEHKRNIYHPLGCLIIRGIVGFK
jgi:hypothetical protein